MSHEEASWHAHVAGLRAEPDATASAAPAMGLASASVGRVVRCGVSFAPMTAGCLLAIQAAARLAEEAGRPIEGPDEVAILVHCLADGEGAFRLAESGDLTGLLQAARRTLAPVEMHDLPGLAIWCAQAVEAATGAPQKKP